MKEEIAMNDICFTYLRDLPIPIALARECMTALTLGRIQLGINYKIIQDHEERYIDLHLSSEETESAKHTIDKIHRLCKTYSVKSEKQDHSIKIHYQ